MTEIDFVFQVPEHPWLGHDRYLNHADVEGERGVHTLNHGGEGGGYAKLLPQNPSRARQEVIQGMGKKIQPCFIRRIIFRYFLDGPINVTDSLMQPFCLRLRIKQRSSALNQRKWLNRYAPSTLTWQNPKLSSRQFQQREGATATTFLPR